MNVRRFAPLAGLLATAAVCLVALHHLGGAVPAPPSWSGRDVAQWASENNPVVVALAVLRLVALGVGYQLIAMSGLALLGSAAHLPALVRASDLLALPGVRGLVRHAVAATLSASTLVAAPAVPATLARPPAATARPAAAAPAGTATLSVDGVGSTATLVVDSAEPGAGQATLTVEAPPATPAVPTAPASAAESTNEPTTWTVARGDHLWSIAERTLSTAWGRAPSEREVDGYWCKVKVGNAGLVDPDLVFVGQQIALPPVPAP